MIKYLSGVKDAKGDLKRLREEVISAVGILFTLKVLSETEDVWLLTVQSLSKPSGPLAQFQSSLEHLAGKLSPTGRLKMRLAWPFQESEVRGILRAIESQKMLFSLALQNDHL